MDTTIFTNILFAVLSIFIVFITIAFTLLVLSIATFFRDISSFLKIINKESEKIAEDVANIRKKIKDGEATLASSMMYVLSFLKNRIKKSKKNIHPIK
jgi:predicted PurR-regulated permease PerM